MSSTPTGGAQDGIYSEGSGGTVRGKQSRRSARLPASPFGRRRGQAVRRVVDNLCAESCFPRRNVSACDALGARVELQHTGPPVSWGLPQAITHSPRAAGERLAVAFVRVEQVRRWRDR